MTISSAATLVDLNMSCWTANVVDRRATKKATTDHRASSEAGLFRKNLMAGTSKRKDIADFAARCRLWHNSRTLPWADRGSRLLPTSLFFDYKQELDRRRDTFERMVDDFIADYPSLQLQAQHHLGDLFDASEYPTTEEVREKFGFRVVFSPVPESGDFRLDLPKEEMEMMRKSYDKAFDDRLADAMREPWDKLHDMLSKMSEKLIEPEDDGVIKRWHDSFIGNAKEMCGMLTHLNLTKDPHLEQARRDLERALAGVTIDDVKEDVSTRADMKQQLDDMLKNYW